jgi:hypothetical protein
MKLRPSIRKCSFLWRMERSDFTLAPGLHCSFSLSIFPMQKTWNQGCGVSIYINVATPHLFVLSSPGTKNFLRLLDSDSTALLGMWSGYINVPTPTPGTLNFLLLQSLAWKCSCNVLRPKFIKKKCTHSLIFIFSIANGLRSDYSVGIKVGGIR